MRPLLAVLLLCACAKNAGPTGNATVAEPLYASCTALCDVQAAGEGCDTEAVRETCSLLCGPVITGIDPACHDAWRAQWTCLAEQPWACTGSMKMNGVSMPQKSELVACQAEMIAAMSCKRK